MKKKFSSSILLWVRADQPRETGMEYWKGPHSGIISASKGLEEYRQVHLAELNEGLWPATPGVETRIPLDRKADGVAEVTFQSLIAPIQGRPQTKLAFQDEINVFRRTIMYLGSPKSSRWYDVAASGEKSGSRALVYLRKRDDISARAFRRYVELELGPALAQTGGLTELRAQTYLPWNKGLWNTPNVAHDNPVEQRYHAALSLGFADLPTRNAFFESQAGARAERLATRASAIHAYDVAETLTYVKDGRILPHYIA